VNINAQLKLIPTPQKVEIQNSFFEFSGKTSIINGQVDTFYLSNLTESVKQEFGFELKCKKQARKSYVEFTKAASLAQFQDALKRDGLDENYEPGAEGYVLKVSEKSIHIVALSDAGIFYGIQTLKQLISANNTGNKIPCLTIYDSPDFPVRGWQDDISRGPISTMEFLKKTIKELASYKLNYMTLYTEHVFKLKKHPSIAPDDGITPEQIEELTRFASKYHIQLIGNYQSFGHMKKTLSKPGYQHLAESKHIITPTLEASYDFLKEVYEEIVPAYSNQYFNINCDETFGLGEGKSKAMADSLGKGGIYLYHINRLSELLKPYDKRILMWNDIISKYPDLVSQLPKDITLMIWSYIATDSFEPGIQAISKTGLNFWVAPGVHSWPNIYPRLGTTEVNVFNLIRDGYKHGATGVLNTSWDDNGFNFSNNNWHGFIWGAENSWNAPSSDLTHTESEEERRQLYTEFNAAFDALFYGLDDKSIVSHMIRFASYSKSPIKRVQDYKRFLEPVIPIHLDYVKKGKREENLDIIRKLDLLSTDIDSLLPEISKHQNTIDNLSYAIRQMRFTARKNILRIDLYKFMNGDKTITEAYLRKFISEMIMEIDLLTADYTVLWKNENRNWWLAYNLKQFDLLKSELEGLIGHCIITVHDELSSKGRKITLQSTFDDLPVYYTTSSDTVTASSKKYTGPLYFNGDVKIVAGAIHNGKGYPLAVDSLIYHTRIGKLHQLNSQYSNFLPAYDGGGIMGLLDGRLGNPDNLKSGRWQGYSGQNIDLEIDLGEVQPVHSFSMGFLQNTHSWIIFPKKIEIFSKNSDESDYKLLKTITNTILPEEKGAIKHEFKTEFENVDTRYLRVVAHYYGKLPEWHHAGSNKESMIFSDEIILD